MNLRVPDTTGKDPIVILDWNATRQIPFKEVVFIYSPQARAAPLRRTN
jgi:hypothetical protein